MGGWWLAAGPLAEGPEDGAVGGWGAGACSLRLSARWSLCFSLLGVASLLLGFRTGSFSRDDLLEPLKTRKEGQKEQSHCTEEAARKPPPPHANQRRQGTRPAHQVQSTPGGSPGPSSPGQSTSPAVIPNPGESAS